MYSALEVETEQQYRFSKLTPSLSADAFKAHVTNKTITKAAQRGRMLAMALAWTEEGLSLRCVKFGPRSWHCMSLSLSNFNFKFRLKLDSEPKKNNLEIQSGCGRRSHVKTLLWSTIISESTTAVVLGPY